MSTLPTLEHLYDQEIERQVLGAILINPDLVYGMTLTKDDFYLIRHQYIYEAIHNLKEQRQAIDRTTLRRELQARDQWDTVGGEGYLTDLINSTPSAVYGMTYAELMQRDAVRRRLFVSAEQIRDVAMNRELSLEEAIANAERHLFRASAGTDVSRAYTTLREAAGALLEDVERAQDQHERMGMPTGFSGLDKLLNGLHRSDLLILAGRPGMGKTALMLSVARNVARIGGTVAIFSLEMNAKQLTQRFAAMETGIPMQRIRSNEFRNDDEYKRLVEAMGRIGEWNVLIDDSASLTPGQLRTKAMRMKFEHGIDLLCLDYIQLMHAPGFHGNRTQEVSYISRQAKELAREMNVPMLANAQLNRELERRKDKRPVLSDLKESGSLEQDSDVVMFLYRDAVYNENTDNPNRADVIVAKHRNGPTDTIPLYFDGPVMTLRDGTRRKIDLGAL